MRNLTITLTLLALASCRRWEQPLFETVEGLPSVTLGELRAYLHGEAEMTFAEDIEIAGRVVSSTRAGNFYNTFFIDDGTGGAEIMAGMYDLDAAFRPGQRVSVHLRGLAVGWRDGAMQLGLPPEPGSRYATGYFYHRAVMRPYVVAERSVEATEPPDVTLDALYAPLPDGSLRGEAFCGRLVRIPGLVAAAAGGTWATTEPSPATGYVDFRPAADPRAEPLTVVTSGYASFASALVPSSAVTLTGILFYGHGGGSSDHFLLKLRDETDVAP
jgi:hypothetical protein